MGIRLSSLSTLCTLFRRIFLYLAVKKLTTASSFYARALVILTTLVEMMFSFRWGVEKISDIYVALHE